MTRLGLRMQWMASVFTRRAPSSPALPAIGPEHSRRADGAARRALLVALEGQSWWRSEVSNVVVIDGIAVLQGLFDRHDARGAALALAARISGVCHVRDDRVRAREWQSWA